MEADRGGRASRTPITPDHVRYHLDCRPNKIASAPPGAPAARSRVWLFQVRCAECNRLARGRRALQGLPPIEQTRTRSLLPELGTAVEISDDEAERAPASRARLLWPFTLSSVTLQGTSLPRPVVTVRPLTSCGVAGAHHQKSFRCPVPSRDSSAS